MNISPELALVAARTTELAECLDDAARDALIAEWSAVLDDLECPGVSRELALVDFRARVEKRLAELPRVPLADRDLVVDQASRRRLERRYP